GNSGERPPAHPGPTDLADAVIERRRPITPPPNLPPEHGLVEADRPGNVGRGDFQVANLPVGTCRRHLTVFPGGGKEDSLRRFPAMWEFCCLLSYRRMSSAPAASSHVVLEVIERGVEVGSHVQHRTFHGAQLPRPG